MEKPQGRVCRYCGHNNKSEKANDCSGCGGSLAPPQVPTRIVGTEPPEPQPPASPLPALVVALACIAVVGMAMVIPLPSRAVTQHPAKHAVQGLLRSHTVSYTTIHEVSESNYSPKVDGCERSRIDSNEAILDYRAGNYFDGFVKADTAVKLAQLNCPHTLMPLRLGYAYSARAFNGRHLDSVDPRMDFEQANDSLAACSDSPQIYGAATAAGCADQQQRNIAASRGLDSRKTVTSA